MRKLITLAGYESSDQTVKSRMIIHRNRIFLGHRHRKTRSIVNMISNMAGPFRVGVFSL